jgi:hypothetical protein
MHMTDRVHNVIPFNSRPEHPACRRLDFERIILEWLAAMNLMGHMPANVQEAFQEYFSGEHSVG